MATGLALDSMPHTAVSAEQPWVDTRFSVFDSDIEVQSSDGFIFQLHRFVLQAGTGSFPGTEIDTQGEVVQLTEPAEVLSILFAFIYPKKHTHLEKQRFHIVAAVAEAAEKYEVFSAMYACNVRMSKSISKHAPEVFAYAIKHDYPQLINEAVRAFARSPFVSVLAKFPPAYVIPWSLYHEAWNSLFKDTTQEIFKISYEYKLACHDSYSSNGKICGTCQRSLLRLVPLLESIDNMPALQEAIKSPRSLHSEIMCCRDQSYEKKACAHMDTLMKFVGERIEKMPSFLSFVNEPV